MSSQELGWLTHYWGRQGQPGLTNNNVQEEQSAVCLAVKIIPLTGKYLIFSPQTRTDEAEKTSSLLPAVFPLPSSSWKVKLQVLRLGQRWSSSGAGGGGGRCWRFLTPRQLPPVWVSDLRHRSASERNTGQMMAPNMILLPLHCILASPIHYPSNKHINY